MGDAIVDKLRDQQMMGGAIVDNGRRIFKKK